MVNVTQITLRHLLGENCASHKKFKDRNVHWQNGYSGLSRCVGIWYNLLQHEQPSGGGRKKYSGTIEKNPMTTAERQKPATNAARLVLTPLEDTSTFADRAY